MLRLTLSRLQLRILRVKKILKSSLTSKAVSTKKLRSIFKRKLTSVINVFLNKDYLSLSVKWNTMETLYNMDNISEYITEHIKSNLLRKSTQFKPTSDEKSLIKNKFKDLPQKIVDIREELSGKKDFIQDLIGDLHTETENLEGEGEGEEESSPEKEEEEVKRNFTNDLPSSKYNINSNPSASKNNNIYLFDEEEEEQEENSETYKSK